jgi:TonB family protein
VNDCILSASDGHGSVGSCRLRPNVVVSIVAVLFVTSAALGGTRTAVQTLPTERASSERRLFSMRSQPAWQAILVRLEQLGLRVEKTDRKNQAVMTKWGTFGSTGLEWLEADAVPSKYVGKRVRYLIFVSPFVEPARVSVASMIEATDSESRIQSLIYNSSTANLALMGQLAKVLGEAHSVPIDFEERRRKTASLLPAAEVSDCLRLPLSEIFRGRKATPPTKISLTDFDIVYAAKDLVSKTEGTVRVDFTILEDGTVTDLTLVGAPVGHQLDASALGASSLLLFSPARVGECSLAAKFTHVVTFRVR